MRPGWFEDVNQDYTPYLEELWKENKVEVPNTEVGTAVLDIVHHYTHEQVTLEATPDGLYVIFSAKLKEVF